MKNLRMLSFLFLTTLFSVACFAMNPMFDAFSNTNADNDANFADYELKSKITYWIMRLKAYKIGGIYRVPTQFQGIVTNLLTQHDIDTLLTRFTSLDALADDGLIAFINDPLNSTLS